MVRLSLIVPTHNRAKLLAESLASFRDQSLSPECYEILVVDNNSTDDTRDVPGVVLRSTNCRWRYMFEPRQGLHCARNKGILEAAGEVVVFGDDDIVAEPTWLEKLLQTFDADASVGVVGGRVKPLWDAPPPSWIYDYGTERVHPVFAYLDYGEEPLELRTEYVFGCNFAIRRNLAIELGGSFPDTFPKKLRHLSGAGENALVDGVRGLHYKVVYSPAAIVYHHAEVQRASLEYFVERHRRWAIEEVFDQVRSRGRFRAAADLIAGALKRVVRAPAVCTGKRKPIYCLTVENASAWQTMCQAARVLVDRSLYEHITRESYL